MREIRTSGSVRDEGGNVLVYSASGTRDLVARNDTVVAAVSVCKKNLAMSSRPVGSHPPASHGTVRKPLDLYGSSRIYEHPLTRVPLVW